MKAGIAEDEFRVENHVRHRALRHVRDAPERGARADGHRRSRARGARGRLLHQRRGARGRALRPGALGFGPRRTDAPESGRGGGADGDGPGLGDGPGARDRARPAAPWRRGARWSGSPGSERRVPAPAASERGRLASGSGLWHGRRRASLDRLVRRAPARAPHPARPDGGRDRRGVPPALPRARRRRLRHRVRERRGPAPRLPAREAQDEARARRLTRPRSRSTAPTRTGSPRPREIAEARGPGLHRHQLRLLGAEDRAPRRGRGLAARSRGDGRDGRAWSSRVGRCRSR